MKGGQLILSKIIIIVATSCEILKLKCTKIDFGWGSLWSWLARKTVRNLPLIMSLTALLAVQPYCRNCCCRTMDISWLA